MKKTISVLICALLIGLAPLFAQKKETRNVDTFTKISFRIPGKLYLRQGSTQKVEIEATKEMLEIIDTEVDGSRLIIHTPNKWNWRSEDKINVYITVKDLEGVSVAGSGDVIGETKFNTGNVALNVSGSGNLNIEVDASGDVQADVSGSGELNVKGTSKNFKSQVSGSGKVEIQQMSIAGNADFAISGSGRIEASGKTNEVKVSISGSGKVLASELVAKTCDVRISGSGNVEVNVQDELDANISGSGSVSYRGNPDKVNANSSGSGRVSKM